MTFGQFFIFFKGSLHYSQLPLHESLVHKEGCITFMIIIILPVRRTCIITDLVIFPHIDSAHSRPVNNTLKTHIRKILHCLTDDTLKSHTVTDIHSLFL